MILRNDVDEISLSVLDKIHLLICLGSVVFPSVPKSELVSDLSLTFVIMFTPFTGLWE